MSYNSNTGPFLINRFVSLCALIVLLVASTRLHADTGMCGGQNITLPFNDVPSNNIFFCAIAGAFFSGLTNGTSSTTYSPSAPVPREQMAAFITRTQDSVLRRGSMRAALNLWATPASIASTALTVVGDLPQLVQSDGADLWVANSNSGTVSRVQASDGRLLDTWTDADFPYGVLVTRGRIYVTGGGPMGHLYGFDPDQPAGAVLTLANLPAGTRGITTDGTFIWTANVSAGSVSKYNPDTTAVQSFFTDFSGPWGILYDGANVWVTDGGDDTLKRINSDGTVAQTVNVGSMPRNAIFDGTNIWVPNAFSDSVTVVRAGGSLAGTVLATVTGNGLDAPETAAFDGQQILVTNSDGNRVSLWKAADLTPLGFVQTGNNTSPIGVCSDGINFWITLSGTNRLARF